MKELRALEVFNTPPAGCMIYPVCDDDSAPHLRAGEFAIVDTNDTDPQHGEVYLVRWLNGSTSIKQLISRPFENQNGSFVGFWTRCLNFEPYNPATHQGNYVGRRSYVDGPRLAEKIRDALVGRVIGILETADIASSEFDARRIGR